MSTNFEASENNKIEPVTILCPHCYEHRTIDEFYKVSTSPTGLSQWCKICMRAANRISAKKRRARMKAPSADAPLEHSEGYKRCIGVYSCGRILPETPEYYQRSLNQFKNGCKSCRAKVYAIKNLYKMGVSHLTIQQALLLEFPRAKEVLPTPTTVVEQETVLDNYIY